jgi:predicted RNA polymerase sigma factor
LAHDGGALLIATSFSQSEAKGPTKVVNTKAKLRITVMPLHTPTRSDLKRRQAKAQAPSLTVLTGPSASELPKELGALSAEFG